MKYIKDKEGFWKIKYHFYDLPKIDTKYTHIITLDLSKAKKIDVVLKRAIHYPFNWNQLVVRHN